ncbi:unnamed protein product [Mycetohabitans rhizoxinica HKI 454]|uniref:Uncharacterized protein n=1 Tax=Mycetohabitans rhizoxinica (strain DSM 19002 / CIP 109453 / HKI 454) TaxID=882378 RepID=E5AQ58_MYCRK|nr:unnamed protein product [Mycetohabitans rhizoxinica HKI 454]
MPELNYQTAFHFAPLSLEQRAPRPVVRARRGYRASA